MTSANLKRKAASIALLKARGVPTIDHLPPLEPDEELALHTPDEVFRRMRANFVYCMRGHSASEGTSLDEFQASFESLNAWDDLSPNERQVVDAKFVPERQSIEATWTIETVYALQWALALAPDLPWPSEICDVQQVMRVIRKTVTSDGLSVRPLEAVLTQMDLHYRLLWTCRQSRIDGEEPVEGLVEQIVLERMRALDWLVHRGIGWDEADLSS